MTESASTVAPSYRETFARSRAAAAYDERVYAAGTAAELLSRVEARVLRGLVVDLRRRLGRVEYLDFACGTGRILSIVAPLVDTVTGIDVSEAMLARAATKVATGPGGARLLRKDVTAPDDEIEGRYDLVTAFRFLTNAEPALRRAVLPRLAARMRDERSRLLINTHGNPWSYRLLTLPWHWWRDRRAGRPLFGYLSTARARRELAEAGFAVERVIGMGFVPQKVVGALPRRAAATLEDGLAGRPAIQRIGLNQLLVCRLR